MPNKEIKGVYILAFTPQKVDPKTLSEISKIAADMMAKKDPVFKTIIDGLLSTKTPMEFANTQFVADVHNPLTMQIALGNWINGQYKVKFKPKLGENFFPHSMRDPQNEPNFILFYFD